MRIQIINSGQITSGPNRGRLNNVPNAAPTCNFWKIIPPTLANHGGVNHVSGSFQVMICILVKSAVKRLRIIQHRLINNPADNDSIIKVANIGQVVWYIPVGIHKIFQSKQDPFLQFFIEPGRFR